MTSIKDAAGVHAAGVDLEDVKASLLADVSVDVGGLKIDGKQGEMLSIPRWAALELERQKLCDIQEDNMVDALKQAVARENAAAEFALSRLDEHFYIKMRAYMRRLPEREREDAQSKLNTLFRIRHGKLIRLADSSELTADLADKMTVEERMFHEKVQALSAELTRQVMGGSS